MLPDNIGMEETKISAQQYTCKIMPFVCNNGNLKTEGEEGSLVPICLFIRRGKRRGSYLYDNHIEQQWVGFP